MGKNFWLGLSLGAVIGTGAGNEQPEGNPDSGEGFGGAKNANSDKESKNGFEGLFSLFGHEVWFYIGGVAGIGDHFGVYLTTGPMIGKNPDWAIGGGVHIAKAFGLGLVIPIRQALHSYARNQDKYGAYFDIAREYIVQGQDLIYKGVSNLPEIASGLERTISNLC